MTQPQKGQEIQLTFSDADGRSWLDSPVPVPVPVREERLSVLKRLDALSTRVDALEEAVAARGATPISSIQHEHDNEEEGR